MIFKKIKTLVVVFTLICLVLSLSACSKNKSANTSQPSTSSETTNQETKGSPLVIGVLPDVDSIPLIIAEAKGYFREEGVEVKLEHFKSAMERDSALQSGKIDGAVSDILAAAFANDGGFKVKITSLTNGTYKLLAGKEKNIDAVEKMKGKDIAISKNTIIEYATDKILEKYGVNPDEVSKVVVPQIPARLEMLQNGKVNAATLPDPLASVAVKNGAKVIESTDRVGINPGVLLFSQQAIEQKENEIKAFYRAYNKAVEFLNQNEKSSYIDIVIEKAGFPQDVKEIINLPKYTKAGLPSKEDFNEVMDWLVKKGLVKKAFSYEELVDGRLIE
ncbi:NitT/TauT family transport system substrate-binding protein [Caldanaerovirga acetigignens]|uniref:NitT/TauT family transport system substrate-binding protein n=1 Tax=Caldanaerovirga acetigignens TaxID=447595 RepID=A0A1M7K325_9FIRM|nr:MetQ/NlpA family ABC transporter substrate-binding protein [Caldanaerovirga acetigignens]SHM59227.1 NitT/TauT family transport system substrate-binding protein [Caldanaerovirga acetigignens]